MKILLILLVVHLTEPKSIEKRQLLYKINDYESIYILDKANQFTLGDDTTVLEDTSSINYLYSNENYLLLGQIDQLVNISLKTNDINEIKVKSDDNVNPVDDCTNSPLCRNYIKVAMPMLNDSVLITCGTRDMQCRSNNDILSNVPTNNWVQSHKPNKNNNIPTYSYMNSVYFFRSTVSTQDIFKQNFMLKNDSVVEFRDIIRLPNGIIKNPNFRTSYGYEDKAYFFFSESDIISQNGIDFKTYDSYIGEVCADDNGKNVNEPTKRFVSFKKTSINCYIPDFEDMAHTKYTEIQEATRPIQILDETSGEKIEIFYAIFTTRRLNEIDSAVCMFKLTSVKQSMSGLFKNNQDKLPRRPLEKCSDYKNLSLIQIENYSRNITKYYKYQMDEAINQRAFFALKNVKFTSILIDYKHSNNHVIYIGTLDGRLLKVINKPSAKSGHTQPVILAEVQVSSEPITNLLMGANYLTIITEKRVKKVYLAEFCANACSQCQSDDPDCKWTDRGCVFTQSIEKQLKCLKYESRLSTSEVSVEKMASQKVAEEGQNFSIGFLFLIFVLTFCVTCILTCTITFYVIKRHYKLIEKTSGQDEHDRIFNFIKTRNFGPTANAVKKKLLNCYETQPVVCVGSRPESASDTPFILTSSSTQSNSPNLFEKSDEMYSSDECFKDSNLIKIC